MAVIMKRAARKRLVHGLSIILLSGLLIASDARAEAVLELVIGGESRQFTRDALLARSDVVSIDVAHDVSYGKAMRYRALPLATLMAGLSLPTDSVIEAVAVDGFAAQLPLNLVTNT